MRIRRALTVPALAVSVLVSSCVSFGGSADMPESADWEALRAGQPFFEASVDRVAAALGSPDGPVEWETQGGLCNFWVTSDEPTRYQGHASASWSDVPGAVRDQLLDDLAEQWRTSGLATLGRSDYQPYSIQADEIGFLLQVIGAVEVGVTPDSPNDRSPGSFSVWALTGCYSLDELAETTK